MKYNNYNQFEGWKPYGATTEYYDIINDKECTYDEYIDHFTNYNGDILCILPTSTFKSKNQAMNCLNQIINYDKK